MITFQINIDKFRRSSSRPAKTGKKFDRVKFSRQFLPGKAERAFLSDYRRSIQWEKTGEKGERRFFRFPFSEIVIDYFSDCICIYRVSGWMGDAPILQLIQKRKR